MGMYTVYSVDDGGWYSEVYSIATGEELHVTGLYPTKEQARVAGLKWVREHPS
jgi:hypothetical protein